jgi:branched-chain amino acid transport system permease protein
MTLFLQQLVDGLAAGAIYASLALALVFSFRSTNIVNFAQGELAVLSAYLAWQLHAWGAPIWFAVAGSLALSVVIGAVLYLALIRRIADAEHLTLVVVTIGLFIVANAVAGLVWGYLGKRFESPLPQDVWEVASVHVSAQAVGTIVVVLAIVGALFLLLERTKVGLAMRAAALFPESARLVGIRVGWMLLLGWAIAAGLGTISGVLAAPQLTLTPTMMHGVLIYAFAAATLGGFDSALGAVVGGFAIGVVENAVGTYVDWLGDDLKILVPFAVIFVVLLVRPTGLFGRKELVRV